MIRKQVSATKLRRYSIFKDFCPKIHLCLRLRSISKCWRIFEALKIWSRRFLGKIYILLEKIVQQIPKNMYIAWKNVTIISIKEILFFIHKVLFQRRTQRHFEMAKIDHFPLKIFVSSKIFKEFAIFKYLQRILDLLKNLLIHLWSIFNLCCNTDHCHK